MNIKKVLNTILFVFLSASVQATVVKFETVLGDFEVQLFDEEAPQTVENFLNYVNDGDYDNSIVHRSVPGAVIQGGAWFLNEDDLLEPIVPDPTIENEFGRSNVRGTVGMARIGGQIDSATSQWFINVADNSEILDNTDEGFTVFGEVLGSGMEVVDAINAVQAYNFAFLFASLESWPLIDFTVGAIPAPENYVLITNVSIVEDQGFQVNSGLSGVWFNPETSGQGVVLEVLPNSNQVFFSWFTYDSVMPTDDVTANIGAPEHRWFTGLGPIEGNSVTFNLLKTTGGLFNNSADVTNEPIGSVTLRFDDCANASIEYAFNDDGPSGQFDIRRVANDNVTLCEQLNE